MPMRQDMETRRFPTLAEDGSPHTVVEVTAYIQMVTFSGPAGWVPEGKSFRLADGSPVEALADGQFRVTETGVLLRKAD